MEQFQKKIRKDGNSFVVTIPKKIYIKLDLHIGDKPIILISKDGKV